MKKLPVLLLGIICFYNSFAQIDSTALNNIFGKKGIVQGSVYKVTFPRFDLKVTVGDFGVKQMKNKRIQIHQYERCHRRPAHRDRRS